MRTLRPIIRAGAYWLAVAAVAAVMAVDVSGAQIGTTPSWLEHWDLVQVSIVLLFGFGVWSARSTLARIDKKFDLLFEWRNEITRQVERLQGEHDAMKGCSVPHRRKADHE